MMSTMVVKVHQAHPLKENRCLHVSCEQRVIDRGLVVGKAVQYCKNEGSKQVENYQYP